MRRYDDQVDVRRGLVAGREAPAEFWWRGRRWAVRAVVAHWVETGAWWEQPGVAALLGVDGDSADLDRDVSPESTSRQNRCVGAVPAEGELLAEREMWWVEATRASPHSGTPGRDVSPAPTRRQNRSVDAASAEVGFGVFEVCFDWVAGAWRLTGSVD